MSCIIFLSVVTSSIAFTISETVLFENFRNWLRSKNSFFGKFVSCGYCLGHWIAFLLVAIYKPRLFESWWLLDYFLTALVIAWISSFQWAALCWLMDKAGK